MTKLTDEQMARIKEGEPHETIWASLDRLEQVSYSLYRLGKAFYRTGNDVVSQELIDLAQFIDDEAAVIKASTNNWIDKDFKAAQMATGNMLTGMLAVSMKLAGKDEEAKRIASSLLKEKDND